MINEDFVDVKLKMKRQKLVIIALSGVVIALGVIHLFF